jgi:multicomponent Na+:H+ antiporter subunit D
VSLLLALPIVIPLATAGVGFLLHRHVRLQRYLAVLGVAALLGASVALLHRVWTGGVVAVQAGNWPAPYGITLVADLLSALMVVLAALVGLVSVVFSLATIDEGRTRFAYYPLIHILLMGVCGAFLTGDLFNLYVWFEVLLIASFVLLVLGGERGQIEGGLKYVILNLVSSAFFLTGVGVLYTVAGTVNLADLSIKLRDVDQPGLVLVISLFFLVAFGVKSAVFPLFFWLPASYHTPPVAVAALFAGLLTKVGVYALYRTFGLVFLQDVDYTHGLLLAIAIATMITGVLGAVAQNEFRRVLSFHIISQIGYMVLGLALFSPLAVAGGIFYIGHHIIVKTNLFLVSGVAHRLRGTYELKKLGGLWKDHPFLGLLFLVPALSLAGLPPLSGFWAKLSLIRAGLDLQAYVAVATALVVGLFTLLSMTKIWGEAFWKPNPSPARAPRLGAGERASLWGPVVAFALITLAISVSAQPLFDLAEGAARQILDPTEYLDAVLGPRP